MHYSSDTTMLFVVFHPGFVCFYTRLDMLIILLPFESSTSSFTRQGTQNATNLFFLDENENINVQSSIGLSNKHYQKNISSINDNKVHEIKKFYFVTNRSRRDQNIIGKPLQFIECLETIQSHIYGSILESLQ